MKTSSDKLKYAKEYREEYKKKISKSKAEYYQLNDSKELANKIIRESKTKRVNVYNEGEITKHFVINSKRFGEVQKIIVKDKDYFWERSIINCLNVRGLYNTASILFKNNRLGFNAPSGALMNNEDNYQTITRKIFLSTEGVYILIEKYIKYEHIQEFKKWFESECITKKEIAVAGIDYKQEFQKFHTLASEFQEKNLVLQEKIKELENIIFESDEMILLNQLSCDDSDKLARETREKNIALNVEVEKYRTMYTEKEKEAEHYKNIYLTASENKNSLVFDMVAIAEILKKNNTIGGRNG